MTAEWNKCQEKEHSPECRGPGDVKHHVKPWLRKRKISQLMGQILACCGDDLSGFRSCPCSHAADILREKLEGPY